MQENDTGGRGWGVTLLRRITQTTVTFEGLTAFAKFLASLQNFASCCEVPASQNDTGGRGWGVTLEGLTAFAKFFTSFRISLHAVRFLLRRNKIKATRLYLSCEHDDTIGLFHLPSKVTL